jgi:hypothetical protein
MDTIALKVIALGIILVLIIACATMLANLAYIAVA